MLLNLNTPLHPKQTYYFPHAKKYKIR